MWSRVISRREQHPLSAIVSSSSSHSICSTFLTPASPPLPRRTGLASLSASPTTEAPSASALKTSVPRRTPPSRNTGTWPCAAFTTCKWATTARSTTAATQLEWRLVREKVG
ncbi:unnamed protein product [Spirodela intermedia]|uniref:Uncharacterized protein n=1 Tax=Spirodela intermedia TaxID=51605 RepID=A0A7I8JIC5_SPIIN|nr:unnamed protein product [Spirodela intermedia]CAA6669904.1 unnamed protein product [Spirodela intermedia]